LIPGTGSGGIETVLIALVHALGQLEGPEDYVVVGPWQEPDWLKPYMGQNQRTARGPRMQAVKQALSPLKPLVRMARRTSAWISGSGESWPRLAKSNGFYEELGCQVIHFPYQHFILSELPSVFNPHDLQHVHYPQFFSPADLKWREVTYGAACRAANTVAVGSDWVKQDIINHYGIPAGKIQTIAWAPPTRAYSEPTEEILETVRRTYSLSGKFALYPAMTWEHKNHVRLLQALAVLRDKQGIEVDLVCTGHQTEFFSNIKKTMTNLQLDHHVRFLGMIPSEHLRAIYRLAQFVIFPSLFEAAGGPLMEAWAEGTPVACSAITSIPEQAANAALLFDPLSVAGIADALNKMATDAGIRETLAQRGFVRLKDFNWEKTAKAYRAVYRRAAGCVLDEEDRFMLGGGPD